MIPPSGQFFFYLKLGEKWLCLVVDGPTSYLIGFITSSVGSDDKLQIREMGRPDGTKYIDNSSNMPWDGGYKSAQHTPVGYDALVMAFFGMHCYVTSGILLQPLRRHLYRWCDIFVIHFPEAGRFDSLLLCNIYNRFDNGGPVGDIPIERARNWSKDCMYVLKKTSEKVLTEGKNKKWKVKRAGKSKTSKVPKEHTQSNCKSIRSGKNKETKVPSSSEDENCNDDCDDASDERFLRTLNDVRLFHRKNSVPQKVSMASMPIQLHNGEAINPPTKELEHSDLDFLLLPFGKFSHDYCAYIDDQWVCRVAGSGKRSVTIANQSTHAKTTDQNSSPSMEHGMTRQVEDTQLRRGSTEKHPVSQMVQDSCARIAKDRIAKRHNCGITNLGNTCYINSTLQCLSTVPELKSILKSVSVDSTYTQVNQAHHNLTLAAHDLLLQLGESVGPVEPHDFVEMLRKGKSEFSKHDNNIYKQQDAEECWSYLITTFDQALSSVPSGSAAVSMKELFGIELMGSPEENFRTEFMYSLKCYISEGIDHLTHGLLQVNSKNNGKFSPDRGAPCNKSKIIEIPRYLTIHFSRLNWNIDSKQPAKVLQRVDYPATFDVKEYCSDELKEKLEATREAFRGSSNEGIDKDVMGSSWKTQQLTGIYGLVCVLTHEGESADYGHYVAWIKQEEEWIKCDDEQIHICYEDEVLSLSGGRDGQVAYICMYKGQTSEIAITPSRD